MKNKQKQEVTKFTKFMTFPERTNYTLLIFLSILSIFIGFVIAAFAMPKREYKYIPAYQEIEFSENLNTYLRLTTNYTNSEEKGLERRENLYIMYKTSADSIKVTDVYASCVGVSRDETLYYMSPSSILTSEITTSSSSVKSSATISGGGFSEIYAKVSYDLVTTIDGKKNYEYDKYLTLKEEMITLTKKEIQTNIKDNPNKEMFVSFTINAEYYEEREGDSTYNLTLSFDLQDEFLKKDHYFDVQTYAIDAKNNQYDLIGYYGISNNNYKSYKYNSSFPKSFKISYLMAKVVLRDNENNTNIFLYKMPFDSQIKS